MRNRLWAELTQAKHNVEFACIYAEKQRTNLKWFNISILVFSTGGIMGWKLWEQLPLVACIIISAVSILRLLQSHIIMTERQISNLDTICNFYTNYYNKLERLWYDNEHGTIDTEMLKTKLFKIKATEGTMTILVNETIRTKPKRLVAKADQFTRNYLKQTFNT